MAESILNSPSLVNIFDVPRWLLIPESALDDGWLEEACGVMNEVADPEISPVQLRDAIEALVRPEGSASLYLTCLATGPDIEPRFVPAVLHLDVLPEEVTAEFLAKSIVDGNGLEGSDGLSEEIDIFEKAVFLAFVRWADDDGLLSDRISFIWDVPNSPLTATVHVYVDDLALSRAGIMAGKLLVGGMVDDEQ